MNKIFRIIVLASLGLYVAWFFIPYWLFGNHSQNILDAYSWAGAEAVIQPSNIFVYGVFLTYIISSIGILFFKNWARVTFFTLTLVSIISQPFSGVVVSYGIDALFYQLVTLMDGAILVLMYFTSISKQFKNVYV